jgi:2-keto-4-pentenoate hydratase
MSLDGVLGISRTCPGATARAGAAVGSGSLNAGIVIPADALETPAAAFLPEVRLGVRINGRMVDEAGLWPLPGGEEASLDWLRRDLARDGLSLKPGQIVIADMPLGLYPVHPGDTIETCIDGAPRVSCSVWPNLRSAS